MKEKISFEIYDYDELENMMSEIRNRIEKELEKIELGASDFIDVAIEIEVRE